MLSEGDQTDVVTTMVLLMMRELDTVKRASLRRGGEDEGVVLSPPSYLI